jgi:hypothetical protein
VLDGLLMEEPEELLRLQKERGIISGGGHAQTAPLCKSMVMVMGERNQSRVSLRHVIHPSW